MSNPTQKVKTREYDLATQVRKEWGEEWKKPEVVYEFGNGRKFIDTGTRGGPYRTS